MIRYNGDYIGFENSDMECFAVESGDRNPLHMNEEYAKTTFYKEPVVFGMLGAITVLKEYDIHPVNLSIKFNSPIFKNRKYSFGKEEKKGKFSYSLEEDGNKLLTIKPLAKELEKTEIPEGGVRYIPMLVIANVLTDEELQQGITWEGEYRPKKRNEDFLYRVLQFCSYAVGMVVPGQQALFVQASISLKTTQAKNDKWHYKIITVSYNEMLRIIENEIYVFCEGILVAICKTQAYVRATFRLDHGETEKATQNYCGKTVLITGGTKGLGAEIAYQYAKGGATVIIIYCHSKENAMKLREQLCKINSKIELIRGDMGNYEDCIEIKKYVTDKYGGIDRLFLCAAIPSAHIEIMVDEYDLFEKYIKVGMEMFSYPFMTLKPVVNDNGKVVILSSSSVSQKKEVPQMMDYISVKTMIECIAECTYYKKKDSASYYIVRPPKMFTEMNNTPTGRIGAINPEIVAEQLIHEIEDIEQKQREYRVIEF